MPFLNTSVIQLQESTQCGRRIKGEKHETQELIRIFVLIYLCMGVCGGGWEGVRMSV